MIHLIDILLEVGEGVQPYQWSGPQEQLGNVIYHFITEDNDSYRVVFTGTNGNDWRLDFYVKESKPESEYNSGTVTNKGRQFKIISTVMDIIKDFIEEYPADAISFAASDKEGSKTNQREELYKKYIIKNIHLLPGWDTNVGVPGQSGQLSIFREEPLDSMEIKEVNKSIVNIDSKFNSELMNTINNEYGEDYISLTPREINNGYCDMWANLFVEKFGGTHQWSYDIPNDPNGHSWVKLNNKFYDAEAKNGVLDLKQLPYFQRIIKQNGSEWLNDEFYKNILTEADEYDVESKQDIKEFIEFMREYTQVLSEGCGCLNEAEYHGRKVQLGKPMQGDIKKFKVYVKNPKGKVVKVNFGFGGKSAHGKRMVIKKHNPKRRAAYRSRHNCDNPGPRWKANYWSCRAW